MKKNLNENQYYANMDVDITLLPYNYRNAIGSDFLEGIYYPMDELKKMFKDCSIEMRRNLNATQYYVNRLESANKDKEDWGTLKTSKTENVVKTEQTPKKKLESNKTDPYTYKGTNVLANKFDITDFDELKNKERQITNKKRLNSNLEKIPLTLSGYYSIHKRLFDELYDWAGKTRNVNIFTGDIKFSPMQNIDSYLDYIFGNIISPNLGALKRISDKNLSSFLATTFGEIIAVHPFRDGNGRSTRVFVDRIASEAGKEINWNKMPEDK